MATVLPITAPFNLQNGKKKNSVEQTRTNPTPDQTGQQSRRNTRCYSIEIFLILTALRRTQILNPQKHQINLFLL